MTGTSSVTQDQGQWEQSRNPLALKYSLIRANPLILAEMLDAGQLNSLQASLRRTEKMVGWARRTLGGSRTKAGSPSSSGSTTACQCASTTGLPTTRPWAPLRTAPLSTPSAWPKGRCADSRTGPYRWSWWASCRRRTPSAPGSSDTSASGTRVPSNPRQADGRLGVVRIRQSDLTWHGCTRRYLRSAAPKVSEMPWARLKAVPRQY